MFEILTQVYSTPTDNEIVFDIGIRFTSSADSEISISLLKVGASISEISFGGNIRVILKPLIGDVPIIGGVQVKVLCSTCGR